jgi:hypothetical protein
MKRELLLNAGAALTVAVCHWAIAGVTTARAQAAMAAQPPIEQLLATAEVGRGGFRHELSTGLTSVVRITRKLEVFAEWDAFYPGGGGASAGPRHYAAGGLVYFVTPDLAVDVRAGIGLNSRSNGFLTGTGFAVRY